MLIHLLGALKVMRDGVEVDLGRRHHRVLLARLLVDPGHAVSVDRLLIDVWAGAPPAGAAASLQSYVSRLRRLLEPDRGPREPPGLLVTTAGGYALQVAPDAIDAHRFESLVRTGHDHLAAGRADQALALLEQGLAMWHGAVLADLADESFVVGMAVRLGARRREGMTDRAAARIVLGDVASAVAELDLLVTEDPLDEGPWALLVTALHRAGRTAEALQRLRQVRAILAEELGLDPGPALQDLEQAILVGDPIRLPHQTAQDLPGPRVTVDPAHRRADRPTDPPRVTRSDTGLCGRRTELDRLEAVVADVLLGRTRWVVVAGEPGIGKTRLVEELAASAADLGLQVGWGRAHEEAGAPAMWPWVQVLRDLETVVPEAADLLGPRPHTSAGGTGDVFALYDRVATTLADAAGHAPLLCVIDDLQWADAESLGLMSFLAVQLRHVPLAMVLTVRTGAEDGAVGRCLTALARTSGAVRLDLGGLDEGASAALVRHVSGVALPPEEAAALHARTAGNPFFVTELARLGTDLPATAVPATVRGVLTHRLEAMPEATTSLLSLAAVAGLEADLDLLAVAGGTGADALLDALEPALTAGLLLTDERGVTVRFRHALLRDAVLADLGQGQRRRLHLRLAAAARQLGADPTFVLAEVAHHLVEAGPLGETAVTLDAIRAATDQATRRLAFHEAARWAERGLEVIDGDRRTDPRERYRFLLAAGCALADAGERTHGLERLAEAIELAEALGDARAMAEAAIAFGRTGGMWSWVEVGARPTRLIDLLDRTLRALGTADSPDRVRVMGVRAVGDYHADPQQGRALAAEALQGARRLGEVDVLTDALLTDVLAGWGSMDVDRLIDRAKELLDLGERHARPAVQLAAWFHLYVHQLVSGDLVAAEEAHAQAWDLAHRLGLAVVVAQLGWGHPLFALARGRLSAVEGLIEEARRRHERTQLYALEMAHDQAVVLLRWQQGRLPEVADRMAHALDWPDLSGQGIQALLAGRADEPLRHELVGLAGRAVQPSYGSLGVLVLRARLVADVGLVEAARVLVPQLVVFAGRWGSMGTVASCGPVDLQLGRLHALLGEGAEAVRLLRRCLDHCRAQGLPLWQGHCERELAALTTTSPPGG